jgi:hypothetical protein
MENRSFDLGALPVGFCPECLDTMRRGRLYETVELESGAKIISAYCFHREVGGTLIVQDGRPQRWSMSVPIDAVAWRAIVSARVVAYGALGAETGLHDGAPAESN